MQGGTFFLDEELDRDVADAQLNAQLVDVCVFCWAHSKQEFLRSCWKERRPRSEGGMSAVSAPLVLQSPWWYFDNVH